MGKMMGCRGVSIPGTFTTADWAGTFLPPLLAGKRRGGGDDICTPRANAVPPCRSCIWHLNRTPHDLWAGTSLVIGAVGIEVPFRQRGYRAWARRWVSVSAARCLVSVVGSRRLGGVCWGESVTISMGFRTPL